MTTAEGLQLEIFRGALPQNEADDAFDHLCQAVAWRQDEISMFGKVIPVPRLSAWYGDPGTTYTYSGIKLEPNPWFEELAALGDRVSRLAETPFNSVLLNLYRNGRDSMGWHSDDEVELGAEPVIASLSLGATRNFQLRRRDNHKVKQTLELHHGDLIVMSGPTQALWAHQIPKTAKPVGQRVNLTFRIVSA